MSIPRNRDGYTPTCDQCGEELESCGTFDEAVAALKEEHWEFEKQADGSWEHYCPACSVF